MINTDASRSVSIQIVYNLAECTKKVNSELVEWRVEQYKIEEI